MSTTHSSGAPPRVFVSYSHDSEAHRTRVLAFGKRLREDGVDARLDRYVRGTPPEGWPSWMHAQIDEAEYVLVVCTEDYERRALKREQPGRGLGATWEAGIVTQLVYEDQGRNTKFVPVVFDEADRAHIPVFLRGATYYNVSVEARYQALLDYLTGEHDAPMPPLGPGRPRTASGQPSPPAERAPSAPPGGVAGMASSGSGAVTGTQAAADPPQVGGGAPAADLRVPPSANAFAGREPVVLRFEDGHVAAFGADHIEAGETLTLDLVATSPEGAVRLQGLRAAGQSSVYGRTATVAVAYGVPPVVTALWARVRDVGQTITGGVTHWRLTLTPQDAPGGMLDEMSANGYSADDIAELRARRILLDERASSRRPGDPRPPVRPNDVPLDSTVDMFVSRAVGGGGGGRDLSLPRVEQSPLPALHAAWTADPDAFLAAARLTAALWLMLTGTVVQVRRFELWFTDDATLLVDFEGVRRKVYSNQPAAVIAVAGVCHLAT